MVDNILWDALSYPHLVDQIRYPAKKMLDELTGKLDNPSKRNAELPHYQKQNRHLGPNN